jgi:two-component system KDP operon response regulator KdpE
LLLDANMPGRNGLQVIEAVRRGAEMPILMISARGRERDRIEALDAGAEDYLTKPFGVGELLARVKALPRRTPDGPRRAQPPCATRVWRWISTLVARASMGPTCS